MYKHGDFYQKCRIGSAESYFLRGNQSHAAGVLHRNPVCKGSQGVSSRDLCPFLAATATLHGESAQPDPKPLQGQKFPQMIRHPARKFLCGEKNIFVMSECVNVHTFQITLLRIHWSEHSSRVSFGKSMASPR